MAWCEDGEVQDLENAIESLCSRLESVEYERDSYKRCFDLVASQISMIGSEVCADPKIDPCDMADIRWTAVLKEASKLRKERDDYLKQLIELRAEFQTMKFKLEASEDRNKRLDDALTRVIEERDDLRCVLSLLSSYVGAGLGEETTSADDYNERIRWGIKHSMTVANKIGAADERERCARVVEREACTWAWKSTRCQNALNDAAAEIRKGE